MGLTREVDPEQMVAALDAALPDGLDVLDAATAGAPALADRIDAGRWRLQVTGVPRADARGGRGGAARRPTR